MFDYLIDTADISYINKLSDITKATRERCLGITTNPKAMNNINHISLAQWESVLPKLCEVVSEIRGDNLGYVHVQIPNSKMSGLEVLEFAIYISKFNDGNTRLALKISPTTDILTNVKKIQEIMPVNVTGLADCGTILSCVTYGVDYVSIIPGRMEEVGIDANEQLKFLIKRGGKTKIISGSMRTLQGLENAVKYKTIPTIGTKVWDQILLNEDILFKEIIGYDGLISNFSPIIDNKNTKLSIDFFEQMDGFGKSVYKDFKND